MKIPRPTTKTKRWTVAQFLEISSLSPKELESSSQSLACETTKNIKLTMLYFGASLALWDGRKASNLERRWTHVPRSTHSFCSVMTVWKEKVAGRASVCAGGSQWIIDAEGWMLRHSSLHAGWTNSPDVFLPVRSAYRIAMGLQAVKT